MFTSDYLISPLKITAAAAEQEGFANVTPLVYFHGSVGPKDNVELYKALVDTMATRINERLSRDIDAQSSGIIVNTCGWIDAEGYDLLLHAIKAFSIDIVLVMNHDKLYSNLVTSLDPAVTTTVKLPRSGGVVQRVRRVFVLLIFICSDHHHQHYNHHHLYHH